MINIVDRVWQTDLFYICCNISKCKLLSGVNDEIENGSNCLSIVYAIVHFDLLGQVMSVSWFQRS